MLANLKNYWAIFINHFSAASNRKLITLIALIAVIVTLPAIAFLAQQQQTIRQRAAGLETTPPYTTLPFPPTATPTPTSAGPCGNVCQADFDKSGKVDAVDFSLLQKCYLKPPTGTCAPIDINKDGKINAVDFSCLSKSYGKLCTSPTN